MNATQTLSDALTSLGLQVTHTADVWEVTRGHGPKSTAVTFDIAAVPAGDSEAAARLQHCAFARGVYAVINEPRNSDAATWDYLACAGRLTPSIEHKAFVDGAAACGQRAWTIEFNDDLVVTYHIELDRGSRLLTWSQFLMWGVTPDRISSASRSLLYYKTAQDALSGEFEPDPASGGHFYQIGDGNDAARALILSDLDFQRVRRGLIFAVPHADILLITDKTDASSLRKFNQAVSDSFGAAQWPLSRGLFTYEDAKHLRRVSVPASAP